MQKIELIGGVYYDSVSLMLTAKETNTLDGVKAASLSMGTEANIRIMENAGFDLTGLAPTPNDLMIGVLGDDDDLLARAIAAARGYLTNPPWKKSGSKSRYLPKTVASALAEAPESNIALISVAGTYAGELAHDCLSRDLHVMLFSDNVSLEKEIQLKKLAQEKGLLLMGPDCGTVMIRGAALGMANAVPIGPVGIVAAAGTGLQEAAVQLARRGVGVMHGLGTGGRDIKSEVGGIMTLMAMEALMADDEISVLLVVGKPPAKEVEARIAELASSAPKPVVLCFIGGELSSEDAPVYRASRLEEAAAIAAALARGDDPSSARAELTARDASFVNEAVERIGKRRGCLRGLYSGGTLSYEAQLTAAPILGPIWSNEPLDKKMQLADSLVSVGHSIVDYGADEFTQGKLHPMIDGEFRCRRIVEEAADPETAVILFDVVLGYGCHPDPGGEAARAVLAAREACGDRVAFVAYVCGVDQDPQNASQQIRALEKAGVTVAPGAAVAALLAASLIERS